MRSFVLFQAARLHVGFVASLKDASIPPFLVEYNFPVDNYRRPIKSYSARRCNGSYRQIRYVVTFGFTSAREL